MCVKCAKVAIFEHLDLTKFHEVAHSAQEAYRKGANVVSCLMEIQRNPVNAAGVKLLLAPD